MSKIKSWEQITAPMEPVDRIEMGAFVVSVVIAAFIAGLIAGVFVASIWSYLA